MEDKKVSPLYKPVRWLVDVFYPSYEIIGLENLPDEPTILVGNHSQLHGPLVGELRLPFRRYIWCAGEMMDIKEVSAYAYRDFWHNKGWYSRWYYKLASYLIAPLAVLIFNNAHTIGVYHDSRVVTTFKTTVKRLQEGNHIVIFPEKEEPHNHILYAFQDRFIDVAKLYHKRTGQELSFVPLYIAPKLKKAYLGKPIRYCATAPIDDERQRIQEQLMAAITEMACALPRHTVVPYRNIPKKDYPTNIPTEETDHEKTYC